MQTRRVLTAGLCGLMAVGLCVFSASQAQAASGNGPYYAEPSWSQKLPAATRFVVLTDWNNEAVLDRNTGLVWEKSPDVARTIWFSAGSSCINKNVGGQKGWRLPSIPELASLIDPTQVNPALPPGHPFIGVSDLFTMYWSTTTSVPNSLFVWGVFFVTGDVLTNPNSVDNRVWCVRGGSNADAY